MKEIAFELGRIVLLLPPEQITPLRGFYAPDAFAAIVKRYSFQSTPDLSAPAEKLQKEGLRFRLGKVPGKDVGPTSITDFTIFPDGFVIDASTTDQSEIFMKDLMRWGKEALGIRDFHSHPRLVYASQVTVRFEPSVNNLVNSFSQIADQLATLMMRTYRLNVPLEFASVRFDYDRLVAPSLYNFVQFVIERKAGQKFEDGLLWCQAPLATNDHLQLLRTIESLLPK